jgi:coenzyme F420-0:L-glutamate ligase/coenzyme F420-1:gamma-L-glutamate ligase
MERQTRRLELIAPPGLPEISPGDDLARLLVDGFAAAGHALQDGDIVVVAQKIVSKSEGRIFDLADVAPGAEAERLAAETGKDARLLELVLRESDGVVRTRPGLIIARHRLGFVVANAAVDHSNGGGGEVAILLPEDPDASAARLRAEISSIVGGDVAVVINDSMGRAWRNGTIGTAAGASGIVALDDRRGRADRDGVVLVSSEIAIADEIASAASLLMGQGDESLPAVLVRGATWAAGDGSASDLVRPLDQDLFR